MAGAAYIGTSGWSYDSWKDKFYEGVPRKRWLEYCAAHFASVEANGTFYRLQRESTFEQWLERTPVDFVFAAKGHRFVTHRKRLTEADETVVNVRENMRPLDPKLAVLFWQLPQRFGADLDRLDAFARTLNRRWRSVRHVMEFRNASWFTDEVAGLLRTRNLANCLSDAADWPMWDAVTSDLVYVRLHGSRRTYVSAYSDAELDAWADRIGRWRGEGRDVYVFFDNDAEGAAPFDALKLMHRAGLRADVRRVDPEQFAG